MPMLRPIPSPHLGAVVHLLNHHYRLIVFCYCPRATCHFNTHTRFTQQKRGRETMRKPQKTIKSQTHTRALHHWQWRKHQLQQLKSAIVVCVASFIRDVGCLDDSGCRWTRPVVIGCVDVSRWRSLSTEQITVCRVCVEQ